MADSSGSHDCVLARSWFTFTGVAAMLVVAAFVCWCLSNSDPPFSQQQYDDGYLQAFQMNVTGPGQMDYKPEFWSMQQGFDDGLSTFNQIYQHPDVGPFSYSRIERFREVLDRIESTDILEPEVKDRILEQLRMDLSEWESTVETESGG